MEEAAAPIRILASEGRPVRATRRHDVGVKRSTAIEHLVELAEVASQRLTLRDTNIGWPLEELWVTDDLLGLADSMEAGTVVLVFDLPAGELVWLALHPVAEWVGEQLRLGKADAVVLSSPGVAGVEPPASPCGPVLEGRHRAR